MSIRSMLSDYLPVLCGWRDTQIQELTVYVGETVVEAFLALEPV